MGPCSSSRTWPVRTDGVAFLQDLAEELAGEVSRIARDLASEDIGRQVHQGVGEIAAVFFAKLIEGQDAKDHTDLVLLQVASVVSILLCLPHRIYITQGTSPG